MDDWKEEQGGATWQAYLRAVEEIETKASILNWDEYNAEKCYRAYELARDLNLPLTAADNYQAHLIYNDAIRKQKADQFWESVVDGLKFCGGVLLFLLFIAFVVTSNPRNLDDRDYYDGRGYTDRARR